MLSIGLADSVNPSTVGPALWLALGRDGARSVARFTVGVFCVYLAGGVALALGPGRAIPHPGATVTHLVELGLGGGTALFAIALWLRRADVARRLAREERRASRSSLLLGAAIMIVELPTAFPYFAAIAAIVASGRGDLAQFLLLVLFNVAFVVPLLGILGVRALAGERGRRRLEAWRARLDRRAGELIPAVLAVIAAVLLLVGGVGLAAQ